MSFLRRLRWLDASPAARVFARTMLREDSKGNLANLNTEFGSRCLDYLTHVDPDLASETVERVFGNLTFDQLRAAKDGRRNLIWCLQKLVFRRETFDRSARLLRRLAVAETEGCSNNATGQFKQIYQLQLSGTEADLKARLLVLDEGLASNEPKERAICLEALGQMLTVGHFGRSGGAEQIGSRERLEDWRPRTYGELCEFYRSAVVRLISIVKSKSDLSNQAKAHLSSHLRGLIQVLGVSDVREMAESVMDSSGFWPGALQGISEWIYFDGKGSDILPEVRKLFYDLLPDDPIDLAVLYTNGWKLDLHDPESHYDTSPSAKHDFEYASRKASEVAAKMAHDASFLDRAVRLFSVGDGNAVFPFAQSLGFAVENPLAIFKKSVQHVEECGGIPNPGFFGGLINAADKRDPTIARDMIKSALQSTKLRSQALSLIGSGKLSVEDIALVVSLIQSGDIPVDQAKILSYGRGLDHLAQTDLMPILLELERHAPDGLWAALEIILMYFYGGSKKMERRVINFIQRILTSQQFLTASKKNTDGYNVEEAVRLLRKHRSLTHKFMVKFIDNLLSLCGSTSARAFYDMDSYIRKILSVFVEIDAAIVWSPIAKKLEDPDWDVRFYINELLSNEFAGDDHMSRRITIPIPNDLILNWVRESPDKRAGMAVAWIPLAVKDETGILHWTSEFEAFIDQFGSVRSTLEVASGRLRPNSTWGSRAPYLEPVVPLLEGWRAHANSDVRRWASGQIDQLNREIADARKEDEEDAVRFS